MDQTILTNMGKISIDRDKCKGCLLCVAFCPQGALVADEKINQKGIKPARVKEGRGCIGCMMCAVICPDCCIEIYK